VYTHCWVGFFLFLVFTLIGSVLFLSLFLLTGIIGLSQSRPCLLLWACGLHFWSPTAYLIGPQKDRHLEPPLLSNNCVTGDVVGGHGQTYCRRISLLASSGAFTFLVRFYLWHCLFAGKKRLMLVLSCNLIVVLCCGFVGPLSFANSVSKSAANSDLPELPGLYHLLLLMYSDCGVDWCWISTKQVPT
jgi:hypothetical protein